MHSPSLKDVVDWSNLVSAFRAAARGKRHREVVAQFEVNLGTELLSLHDELATQRYEPRPYRHFVVHEAKRRVISAAHFRDRVVHHALVRQTLPAIEAHFSPASYANRVGFGTHRAIHAFQYYAQIFRFVLRMDIVQHFPSLDHRILQERLQSYFPDPGIGWLIDTILSNKTAAPRARTSPIRFPGDKLLSGMRPRGLPIGNLTSQVWSNVYLTPLDHEIRAQFPNVGYIRYVDDFALFSNTKSELWRAKRTVCERLESYRLKIHSEQAQVFPTTKGVPWLGCVIWSSHRRIKARKVRHFTRRLRDRIRAYLEGQISFAELQATVEGFSAHAAHTDSHGLIPHILETVGWQRVHS